MKVECHSCAVTYHLRKHIRSTITSFLNFVR